MAITNPVFRAGVHRVRGRDGTHHVRLWDADRPLQRRLAPAVAAHGGSAGAAGCQSDGGFRITRAQTASLFAAFTVPFLVMFLWLGQVLPVPADGAFVMGAVVSGLFIGLGVYRYNLFDLVPLAREMVFDELNDAVIVVDRDRRLLDYNYVAIETFPGLEGQIGSDVTDLLPALTGDEDSDSDGPFPSLIYDLQ